MSIKFFISYSNSDKNKMEAIKKAIESIRKEFEVVVIAKSPAPGSPLSNKVEIGINECDFFVPILTKNSIYSQWVNQEIGYANAKNKFLLPLIDSNIATQLKGFIHHNIDLPFQFHSNENKRKEASEFRKCYREFIKYIRSSVIVIVFKSDIKSKRIKQGNFYTTKVKFEGVLKNGFFDNYVKHLDSNWTTWNWDKNSLNNLGPTAPGKLSGKVNIETKYKWRTENWPKGKYLIFVRVYDHLNPGLPGRVLVAEQVHQIEVI